MYMIVQSIEAMDDEGGEHSLAKALFQLKEAFCLFKLDRNGVGSPSDVFVLALKVLDLMVDVEPNWPLY